MWLFGDGTVFDGFDRHRYSNWSTDAGGICFGNRTLLSSSCRRIPPSEAKWARQKSPFCSHRSRLLLPEGTEDSASHMKVCNSHSTASGQQLGSCKARGPLWQLADALWEQQEWRIVRPIPIVAHHCSRLDSPIETDVSG